jgi:hypothetical protein
MVYRVRKESSAIQQQAYWGEPLNGNVKMRQRKDLGRTIHEEAEIFRNTWKGQANSWRKRPLALFH